MTTTSSVYVTPRKATVDQNRNIEASPNNQLYAGLPDLQSPPRRRLHVDSFPNLLATGASPSSGAFGFPRLPDSAEGIPGGSTPPREGKSDPAFDTALKRYDALPGRSPLTDFSSPSSRSLFSLKEPPLPIFHASPRRPLDPSGIPSYLSPDKSVHFERLDDFTFSPPPAAPPQDATSLLFQDSYSRISPTNLSAVAAAARDGDKFLTKFNVNSMMVPVEDGKDHETAANKPRRRMLNFDVAAEVKPGIDTENATEGEPKPECETRTTVTKHIDNAAINGSTSPQLPPPPPLSSGLTMSIDALTATSPMAMRPEIIRREDIIDSPAVKEATNAAVEAALNANTSMNMTVTRRRRVATSAAMAGYVGHGAQNRRRLKPRNLQTSPSSSELDDLNGIDDELDREQGAHQEYGGEEELIMGDRSWRSRAGRRRKGRSTDTLSDTNYCDKSIINDRSTAKERLTITATPIGRTSLSNPNGGYLGVLGGVVRCNCKKSRCMKMYCDCFKAQGFCGHACSCQGCSNKEDNAKAVLEARESILARNPHAFEEKIVAVEEGVNVVGPSGASLGARASGAVVSTLNRGRGTPNAMGIGLGLGRGGDVLQHRRGCNCKKSKCLKKYCECFQAGVPCGDACKCEECHNKSSETRINSVTKPVIPPPLHEISDGRQGNIEASQEPVARPSDEGATPPAVSLLQKIWFLQLQNQGQSRTLNPKRPRGIDLASAAAAIASGKLHQQQPASSAAEASGVSPRGTGSTAGGTGVHLNQRLSLGSFGSLGSVAPRDLQGSKEIDGPKMSDGVCQGLSNRITTGDGQVLVPLPLHALKRVSPIPGLTPVAGSLTVMHQGSPEKDAEVGKRKRTDSFEPSQTKRAK